MVEYGGYFLLHCRFISLDKFRHDAYDCRFLFYSLFFYYGLNYLYRIITELRASVSVNINIGQWYRLLIIRSKNTPLLYLISY